MTIILIKTTKLINFNFNKYNNEINNNNNNNNNN